VQIYLGLHISIKKVYAYSLLPGYRRRSCDI